MNQRTTAAITVLSLGALAMLTGCGGGGAFSLDVSDPTVSLMQGERMSVEVPISRTGGFTGEVAFRAEGVPDGVEALFEPQQTTEAVTTLALTVRDDAPVGNHEIIVQGESGRIQDSFTLSLEVEPSPDFDVSLPFTFLTLEQGERTELEITVERTGGFAEDVQLAVTDPTETLTVELLQENDRALLYIEVERDAPEANVNLELNATANDRVRKATLEVTVVGVARFDLRADPSSLQLTRDASQEITVHVERWAGFDRPVTLQIDGLPDGVYAEISPDAVPDREATITLHADDTARLGTFTFTITGSADDLAAETFIDMAIVGR